MFRKIVNTELKFQKLLKWIEGDDKCNIDRDYSGFNVLMSDSGPLITHVIRITL